MTIHINRNILIAAAAAIVVVAALGLAALFENDDPSLPSEVARVGEAYRVLERHYVDRDQLDPEALTAAAIRGMVDSLDDPFTNYFTPDQNRAATEDIEGSYTGIGAEVTMRDNRPTVVSPIPDTPAEQAGIMAGDVFVAVDGESLEGLSLDGVIDLIRAPKGEPVDLTMFRPRTEETLEFSIVRDVIRTVTVRTEPIDDRITRVQITRFSTPTAKDFKEALEGLNETGTKGIILDLRNNPGGLVSVVIEVASQFLDGGLVGYEVDADGERDDWQVKDGGVAKDIPLVVLVNGGSASGSEVVSGALQSRGRAQLIGVQTFGKGSVTLPVTLSDGSGVQVTTTRWFTPTGEQIGSVGITPDILLERTAEDIAAGRDPQLERAIEALESIIGQLAAAQAGGLRGG